MVMQIGDIRVTDEPGVVAEAEVLASEGTDAVRTALFSLAEVEATTRSVSVLLHNEHY